jgi:hypothetical protein
VTTADDGGRRLDRLHDDRPLGPDCDRDANADADRHDRDHDDRRALKNSAAPSPLMTQISASSTTHSRR